ncbi:hypothetical protein [Pedobacter agri]|uniref:hypothetical protein n=1 Tax=Pedobacter agri TaxID=454586 RepID=UPI0027D898AA|nr:hypothetical protein [Pedobacter agri]
MLFDKANLKKNSVEESITYELIEWKSFDATVPVYFQIHANNIYSYFSSALISPRYEENSSFADIQSANPCRLTLSNGFVGSVQERTILLQLELNSDEVASLEISGGVAMFDKPLPISRVKGILVAQRELVYEIVSTAAVGDGGIIPERLFGYFKGKHFLLPLPAANVKSEDAPQSILLFDKILGALTFLKNYSILLGNRTSSIKTLPDHFLVATKVLNQNYSWKVEDDRISNFFKILFGMNANDQPQLQWLVKRMLKSENFTDNDVFLFADFIASTKEEFYDEARDMFNGLMKSLERKNVIREIPQLKSNDKFYLYLFAILRQYGNINTEDKSISRADLPQLVFPGYGEYTFASLGFFYGYKNLRNYEDRLKLKDPVFEQLFVKDKRLPLKFSLDTAFELSLVEAVYQYVFNGKTRTIISDYRGFPQLSVELIRRPQNIEGRYVFDGMVVNGKAINKLIRKNGHDRLEQLLQHVQDIPAITVIGSRCYRNNLPIHSIAINQIGKVETKSVFFFKKEDLLTAVKSGVLQSDEVIEDVMFGFSVKEL